MKTHWVQICLTCFVWGGAYIYIYNYPYWSTSSFFKWPQNRCHIMLLLSFMSSLSVINLAWVLASYHKRKAVIYFGGCDLNFVENRGKKEAFSWIPVNNYCESVLISKKLYQVVFTTSRRLGLIFLLWLRIPEFHLKFIDLFEIRPQCIVPQKWRMLLNFFGDATKHSIFLGKYLSKCIGISMKLYHKISYNKREILTDLKGLGQAFLGFDEKRRVSNKHFLHLCILKIAYFFCLIW